MATSNTGVISVNYQTHPDGGMEGDGPLQNPTAADMVMMEPEQAERSLLDLSFQDRQTTDQAGQQDLNSRTNESSLQAEHDTCGTSDAQTQHTGSRKRQGCVIEESPDLKKQKGSLPVAVSDTGSADEILVRNPDLAKKHKSSQGPKEAAEEAGGKALDPPIVDLTEDISKQESSTVSGSKSPEKTTPAPEVNGGMVDLSCTTALESEINQCLQNGPILEAHGKPSGDPSEIVTRAEHDAMRENANGIYIRLRKANHELKGGKAEAEKKYARMEEDKDQWRSKALKLENEVKVLVSKNEKWRKDLSTKLTKMKQQDIVSQMRDAESAWQAEFDAQNAKHRKDRQKMTVAVAEREILAEQEAKRLHKLAKEMKMEQKAEIKKARPETNTRIKQLEVQVNGLTFRASKLEQDNKYLTMKCEEWKDKCEALTEDIEAKATAHLTLKDNHAEAKKCLVKQAAEARDTMEKHRKEVKTIQETHKAEMEQSDRRFQFANNNYQQSQQRIIDYQRGLRMLTDQNERNIKVKAALDRRILELEDANRHLQAGPKVATPAASKAPEPAATKLPVAADPPVAQNPADDASLYRTSLDIGQSLDHNAAHNAAVTEAAQATTSPLIDPGDDDLQEIFPTASWGPANSLWRTIN